MAREKKVSVIHYLNKKLKPHKVDEGLAYPVYLRMRYDGAMTEIKSNYLSIDNESPRPSYFNEEGVFEKLDYLTEEDFSKQYYQKLFGLEAIAVKLAISHYAKHGINVVKEFRPVFFQLILEKIIYVVSDQMLEELRLEIINYDLKLSRFIDWNGDFEIIVSSINKFLKPGLVEDIHLKFPRLKFYENIYSEFGKNRMLSKVMIYEIFIDALENVPLSKNGKKYINEVIGEILHQYKE